eukprot:TRINITY_DN18079_c0_g1_i1.p2 TRINITY_DN18079_c0_g1~~TRINITY_DN18079_c0_g1_i1.p2  ORF type:complete len:210 (+),score=59.32 TRINITY_DN18079_c0_g1_i1:76-630(+)
MNETTGAAVKVHIQCTTGFELSDALTQALLVSDRTGGVVQGVQGSALLVVWNATRRCDGYVRASMQFVAALCVQMRGVYVLGASNGKMLHGSVSGGLRQRFVTAIGSCIGLCSRLVHAAEEGGYDGLYAPLVNVDEETLMGFEKNCEWVHCGEPLGVYVPKSNRIMRIPQIDYDAAFYKCEQIE